MKLVQRKTEPNDGETLVLMKMFVPLDPPVPEASIPSGLQLCEPINTLLCLSYFELGFYCLKLSSNRLSTNFETWQIQVFIKLEVMTTLKLNFRNWKTKWNRNWQCLKDRSLKINYVTEKYRRKPKCLSVKDWLNNTWFSHVRKSTCLLKWIRYIYCVWTWKNGHDILSETIDRKMYSMNTF